MRSSSGCAKTASSVFCATAGLLAISVRTSIERNFILFTISPTQSTQQCSTQTEHTDKAHDHSNNLYTGALETQFHFLLPRRNQHHRMLTPLQLAAACAPIREITHAHNMRSSR